MIYILIVTEDEDIGAGVSSSGAGAGDSAAISDSDGAVSSSVAGSNGAPLPPADAAHALATLASAALDHRHEQVYDVTSSSSVMTPIMARHYRCRFTLCDVTSVHDVPAIDCPMML